METKSLRV
jgi:hypothetical protein